MNYMLCEHKTINIFLLLCLMQVVRWVYSSFEKLSECWWCSIAILLLVIAVIIPAPWAHLFLKVMEADFQVNDSLPKAGNASVHWVQKYRKKYKIRQMPSHIHLNLLTVNNHTYTEYVDLLSCRCGETDICAKCR